MKAAGAGRRSSRRTSILDHGMTWNARRNVERRWNTTSKTDVVLRLRFLRGLSTSGRWAVSRLCHMRPATWGEYGLYPTIGTESRIRKPLTRANVDAGTGGPCQWHRPRAHRLKGKTHSAVLRQDASRVKLHLKRSKEGARRHDLEKQRHRDQGPQNRPPTRGNARGTSWIAGATAPVKAASPSHTPPQARLLRADIPTPGPPAPTDEGPERLPRRRGSST